MGNDGVCRVGELGETFPDLNQLRFPYTPYPSSNWVKPLNNKIGFIYLYFFLYFPFGDTLCNGGDGRKMAPSRAPRWWNVDHKGGLAHFRGKPDCGWGSLHGSVTPWRVVEGHVGDNIPRAADRNQAEGSSLVSGGINTSSYTLPGAQTVAAARLKALFFANRCDIHPEKHRCHSRLNSNSTFLVLLSDWEIQEGEKSPS